MSSIASQVGTVPGSVAAAAKDGRKKGGTQPVSAWVGNVVHRFIQLAYVSERDAHPVVCERRLFLNGVHRKQSLVMDTVLTSTDPHDPQLPAHPYGADLFALHHAFRTQGEGKRVGYLRPDILDLQTREIFEIKSESQAHTGLPDLKEKIARFNKLVAYYRRNAPDEPKWRPLKNLKEIRPGVWEPPAVVPVGREVRYAYLAAPGLILYSKPRRPRGANRARSAVTMIPALEWRELNKLDREAAQLRSAEQRLKVAGVAVVALVILLVILSRGSVLAPALEGVGAAGRVGGGAAATGNAAAQAARVLLRASRRRPPRWDPGPARADFSKEAAAVTAMLGPDPDAWAGEEPATVEPPPAPIRNTEEFLAEVASEFVLGLPQGSAAIQVREMLSEEGAHEDLVLGAVERQRELISRLLVALAEESGGLEGLLRLLGQPEASFTPQALAGRLLENRDLRLALDAMELLIDAPDEWVGELVEDEPE